MVYPVVSLFKVIFFVIRFSVTIHRPEVRNLWSVKYPKQDSILCYFTLANSLNSSIMEEILQYRSYYVACSVFFRSWKTERKSGGIKFVLLKEN